MPGCSSKIVGGAKVLGKLSVPGRPTNLDYSRARAYCACSRCGWGLCGHFSLVYHFSLLSSSLWETARSRLKYCLKGPLNPKQPTNQLVPKSVCFQFISLNEQFYLSDVRNKASIINLFIPLHSKHAFYNAASFHNNLPVHKSQACHQTFRAA